MKIKLIPSRREAQLVASVSGDSITLNGETFDFAALQNGDSLPSTAVSSEWIYGDIWREGGEIHIGLILPHGPGAPQETRFPAAYSVPMTVDDGYVPLPPYGDEQGEDIHQFPKQPGVEGVL